MFSSERLVGYWEPSDDRIHPQFGNSNAMTSLLLAKANFSSSPKCYNCVLQQNASGLVEVVSVRSIAQSEPIVCWFADSYLKNIKSEHECI